MNDIVIVLSSGLDEARKEQKYHFASYEQVWASCRAIFISYRFVTGRIQEADISGHPVVRALGSGCFHLEWGEELSSVIHQSPVSPDCL